MGVFAFGGVLSTWLGLLGSCLFHFPSGATIVLASTLIFIASAAFSPKRRVEKP
jgi:manganese/iron transport system permease protein